MNCLATLVIAACLAASALATLPGLSNPLPGPLQPLPGVPVSLPGTDLGACDVSKIWSTCSSQVVLKYLPVAQEHFVKLIELARTFCAGIGHPNCGGVLAGTPDLAGLLAGAFGGALGSGLGGLGGSGLGGALGGATGVAGLATGLATGLAGDAIKEATGSVAGAVSSLPIPPGLPIPL